MSREHKTRICVDCGATFDAYRDWQIRCPKCQHEHRKAEDKRRYHEICLKEKAKKKAAKTKTHGAIVDGHEQICRYMASCYYGQDSELGCSYCLETGKSRLSQGLFIVDGKCPAYEQKDRRKRHNRQRPMSATGRRDKLFFEV